MPETWRSELKSWAKQYAAELSKRDGILGVVIGGSLARGQEWRHSDLEIGILVDEKIKEIQYFNVDAGHGVELIQLVRKDLEDQVHQVEQGDFLAILNWPIQLFQCQVVHDPSGILVRFKKQFDSGLFKSEVVENKIAGIRQKIDKTLDEARDLLNQNRPAAALVRTRSAMNDAILALHWTYRELPRSQNRTDSRLRLLCRKHSNMHFYDLYRDVFALSETGRVIKRIWPLVREQVLAITRLWGDSAHDFFEFAVDSHFGWRQNAGILTVYRLYIPIIGGPDQGLFGKLDAPDWIAENQDLVHFLGLKNANIEYVSTLIELIAQHCNSFVVAQVSA
jgi:predicted nucleotidyltransferase